MERYFKAGLVNAGFDTGLSETPIVPVMVGEAARAHEFSRALFDRGVFATGIGFPTVPEGKARVRCILSAAHTMPELDQAIDVMSSVGKQLGLI
jgi:glycine C-acetyltransferase